MIVYFDKTLNSINTASHSVKVKVFSHAYSLDTVFTIIIIENVSATFHAMFDH